MDLQDWLVDAKCRRKDNSFWYPPLDAENPDAYYAVGREVCHRCPVWDKCLDKGIDEKWGMWGGLTPQERTALVNPTPKPNILKAHGSWIRYRQGCQCGDCFTAHTQEVSDINMNVIPEWHGVVEDLEMLRFSLLTP